MSIEISHLTKTYDGKYVLRDLTLTFEKGGLYLLSGPSGIGKTTLLHIMMGLIPPDAGSALPALRYSAVFQENRLFENRTPVENLRPAAPAGTNPAAIRSLLAELLPEDCLDQPVRELSGGMQRRTAIARALISPSDCIIMDEPFTGLDKDTIRHTLEVIMNRRSGRTLIIASHQAEYLEALHPETIILPAV